MGQREGPKTKVRSGVRNALENVFDRVNRLGKKVDQMYALVMFLSIF